MKASYIHLSAPEYIYIAKKGGRHFKEFNHPYVRGVHVAVNLMQPFFLK